MGLEIDSVRDFDQAAWSALSKSNQRSEPSLHEAIYSKTTSDGRFNRQASLDSSETSSDRKAKMVFLNMTSSEAITAKSRRGGGDSGGSSVRAEVKVSWGDKDGPEYSISGSGEVHDNKGNSIEATVKHDSDGKTDLSVAAEASKDSSSDKK